MKSKLSYRPRLAPIVPDGYLQSLWCPLALEGSQMLLQPSPSATSMPFTDYALILASRVARSSTYRQYYRSLLMRGGTVILDNDAWETGASSNLTMLMEVIDSLRPYQERAGSLIVTCPDVLNQPEKSCEATIAGMHQLRSTYGHTISYLAIPQGPAYEDWLTSATVLAGLDPDYWGITRCIAIEQNSEIPEGVILSAIKFLVDNHYSKVIANTHLNIHLFGMGPLRSAYAHVFSYTPQDYAVMGLDTAKMFSAASYGTLWTQEMLTSPSYIPTPRPHDFADIPHDAQIAARTLHNCRALQEFLT